MNFAFGIMTAARDGLVQRADVAGTTGSARGSPRAGEQCVAVHGSVRIAQRSCPWPGLVGITQLPDCNKLNS